MPPFFSSQRSQSLQFARTVPALWFADHDILKRLDIENNVIVQSLTDKEPTALAIDPRDGALWLLIKKRLIKFDTDGRVIRDVDLRKAAVWKSDPLYLVLDPYLGNLWIADETLLLRLDASGNKLAQGSSAEPIRGISLDADESAWVLTNKALSHLTSQATLKEQVALKELMNAPRMLAVDSLGGVVWIASRTKLVRFDLNNIAAKSSTIFLPSAQETSTEDNDDGTSDELTGGEVLALACHPIFGTVWVALKDELLFFDRNGSYIKRVALSGYGIDKPQAVTYEPRGPGLWLASRKSLLRFTTNGDFVVSIMPDKEISAVGVEPFRVLPNASILAPADGVLTNNPYSPFRVGLSALCSGIQCSLGSAYLQSFTLDASLNNQAIGPLFSRSGDEVHYMPSARLSEGGNVLNVKVTDLFGHPSVQSTSRFTVDTIPPKFLSLTPADEVSIGSPSTTIQGSVDDPTATVTLLDSEGNGIALSSGGAFSFATTLHPGANVFTLTARDQAGNAASTSLTVIYNALSFVVTSIAPGAAVDADQLSLNGNIEGPDNTGVTVNGNVATVYGGKFYVNNVPLQPGPNTITVTATTSDGQTLTKTFTVTSNGRQPFRATVSPHSGVAPLRTSFTITNQSAAATARIAADFDGNGVIDLVTADRTAPISFTYTSPGVYQPIVFVTDRYGATSSTTLSVVVQDSARMDALFNSIWSGMNSALATGNLAGANRYMSLNAQRKYQRILQALQPHLGAIVSSYSPLQRVSVLENIGEYAINRTYQGQNRLYLIYFLKGADGVWRVEGM